MIDTITRCLGLVKQYNPLATAPGALIKADNCVIRRENIIENRRGYKLNSTYSNNITTLLNFSGEVIVHSSSDSKLSYNDGTSKVLTGTYAAPSGAKMRGVEAYSNLYITTNKGVKVLESLSTSIEARSVGAPRSLDASYALTSNSTGFLADDNQCAYRTLIKRTDSNKNVLFGYPSQRLWVTNSSGNAEDVTLTITLSNDTDEGDILQVYRTTTLSGVSSDSSGDEMGLVYEYTLTSGDISTGSVTFTDSITDSLIGATLYTSPSQEGIAQANQRPPVSKDIALYKSKFQFYANTETAQQLTFTLVGTSGLSSKTLEIAGVTYNFGATEIVSGAGSPQAKVSATGVAAVDIDETARSLVRVINRYASNSAVYAYYLTGPDDLPGQILLVEQTLGGTAFTITAEDSTIGAMTFPEAPSSGTSSAMTSSNQRQKNALYYSKAQQPEAVPVLNYLPVGPANKEILRIAPLRDSLIIVSEAGVFRLTGEDPGSFTVTTLDETVKCKALETIQVLANQVIMLTNQGVVRVSENGVDVISRDIEQIITPILSISSYEGKTRAVAYESERSYLLSTIESSASTGPDVTYVFNIFTNTWVKWTFGFETAIVEDSDDKLYFAKAASTSLFVERKDFSDSDYSDEDISISITSLSGNTIEFTISGGTPQVGWSVKQGTTAIPIGELFQIAGGYRATLTQDPPGSWATGAATIYSSVEMEFEYMGWTAKEPAMLKQVRSAAVLADDTEGANSVTRLEMGFKTNFDLNRERIQVDKPTRGWGAAWGASAWGGSGDSFGYVTYVPMNKQYCNRMYFNVRHRNALERLSVAGISFEFNAVSEEVGI